MRLLHVPTDEEIRARRREAYLQAWPIEKQMEAHGEAAMGRTEKLAEMIRDFEEVRRDLPYAEL